MVEYNDYEEYEEVMEDKTEFAEIYEMFLSRIREDFYSDPSIPTEEKESDMYLLLKRAITKFPYPRVNLNDRDDAARVFNQRLDDKAIEILAVAMKLEWARRKISDINLMRQEFSDRDFQLTSQASHLNALLEVEERTKEELTHMLRWYNREVNGKPNIGGLTGGAL